MNNLIVIRPERQGTQQHPGISDWGMDLIERFIDIVHYDGPAEAERRLNDN